MWWVIFIFLLFFFKIFLEIFSFLGIMDESVLVTIELEMLLILTLEVDFSHAYREVT